MIRVSIIGSGNVAQHLVSAFGKSTAEIAQVYARNPENLPAGLVPKQKVISDLNLLEPADLYIISVSDSAIAEISGKLPFTGRLVAHTSGTMPMESLDRKNRRAVFYPLQTFTKGKEVDFTGIPLCLEAETDSDFAILKTAAEALSGNTVAINSAQRKALHVAAVFVSNFTNHMYSIGEKICKENNIPFDILKPLISETADKVMALPPASAQTGPAIRNDRTTIDAHLEFLSDENLRNIYKTLTESIADGKKL